MIKIGCIIMYEDLRPNWRLSKIFAITTWVLQRDVLASLDYVLKRSSGDFGYTTQKRNTRDNSGRSVRSTTRSNDCKVNDLAFADNIVLLENDLIQAKRQLDSLKTEAGKVGLKFKIQKTQQMRLNQSANFLTVDPLVNNGQTVK